MPLDDRLKRAVDSLGDKLRDEIAKELATLDLAPPQTAAAAGRLADSLRAIDEAASLSDILETLSTLVSLESARSGVFVMSGGRLRGFRVVDIPDDVDRLPSDLKSFPLVLAGSQVGAVYAESGADLAAIEILTRFASRALQAMTAMKTARAVAEGQIPSTSSGHRA
jgi:hypothetical protein